MSINRAGEMRGIVILKLVACCIILCGLSLLMASLSSPDRLQQILAPWGEGGTITPAVVAKLVWVARAAGAFLLLVGLITFCVSASLALGLQQVHRKLTGELLILRAAVRRFVVEGRRYWVPLVLIMLCGIYVRWLYLFHPIALDEAHTFMVFARRPWYIAMSDLSEYNNHIFHTLLVHLVTRLGESEAFIRIPAFIAGILMIGVMYIFCCRFYNRETGLLAAALIASSAPLVDYSTQGRGYTIFILFALLIWICASSILNRAGLLPWIGFVLFSMLGMYTLPVFIYPLFACILWLLLTTWQDAKWDGVRYLLPRLVVSGVIMVGGTVLLYMPILVASGVGRFANPRILPWPMADFLRAVPSALRHIWGYYHLGYPAWGEMVLAAGVVVGVVRPRACGKHAVPTMIPLIIVCTALFVWQRRIPVGGMGRLCLFLVPFYLALSAAGITWLLRRLMTGRDVYFRRAVAISACCLAIVLGYRVMNLGWISGFTTAPEPVHFESEPIVKYIESRMQPSDVFLVNSAAMTFQYYFYRHGVANEIATGAYSSDGDLYLLLIPSGIYTDRVNRLLEEVSDQYEEKELLRDFKYSSLYLMRKTNDNP